MEFFLNVFTVFSEFKDKKYLSSKGLKPVTSCAVDQSVTTRKTHVRDRIFKLNPSNSSLIYQIQLAQITEFNETIIPFRKNSIHQDDFRQTIRKGRVYNHNLVSLLIIFHRMCT